MSTPIPRYLVPFHPKHVPHFFTDVLIVGSGLAGLRAALGVDAKLSVVVATKQAAKQSNSSQAQGGIAGVLDPQDRFEDHVADTLEAGGTLKTDSRGIAPEELQGAIRRGVVKVNIATDLRLLWTRVCREFFRDTPEMFDPAIPGRTYMQELELLVGQKCRELIVEGA